MIKYSIILEYLYLDHLLFEDMAVLTKVLTFSYIRARSSIRVCTIFIWDDLLLFLANFRTTFMIIDCFKNVIMLFILLCNGCFIFFCVLNLFYSWFQSNWIYFWHCAKFFEEFMLFQPTFSLFIELISAVYYLLHHSIFL